MKLHIRSVVTLMLVTIMAAALGACSSPSSPTADDGISSLKGIDGAFDESGESGIHPDTWEDDHQGLPRADLASCVSCHSDTAVDEAGCLPCHTGAVDDDDDDEADDEANPHPESWEDDHQTQTDFSTCVSCHADTTVDEQGCLPCHTGDENEDDEEDEDESDDDDDDDD